MKKILLVEDNELIRGVCVDIISILAPKEFEIVTALNGKEGLEKIQKEGPFYALVTDFNMPQMNGGELVREVIKLKIPLDRIIILSGQSENELAISEIEKENYRVTFQSKPFKPEKLISLLREEPSEQKEIQSS